MAVKVKTKNVVDYIDYFCIGKEVSEDIEKLLPEDNIYISFYGDDYYRILHILLSKYNSIGPAIREPVILDSVNTAIYDASEFCKRIEVLTK